MHKDRRQSLYAQLLHSHAAAREAEDRWTWLMAAHVIGQADFRLHWDSHCRMLALAWRTRDWREVAGQLMRLALVPVGHATGRLPLGNVGRATVSAFARMRPGVEVRRRIAVARATMRG